MHAFLYVGATGAIRREKITEQLTSWNISTLDTIVITPSEEHIAISDIRALRHRVMLAPMNSAYVVGTIYDAATMTPEAQNALLKLLEEPPPRVRFLIETANDTLLLPTIVSRCALVKVQNPAPQKENADIAKQLQLLLSAPISTKLSFTEAYSTDRQQAKAFVEEAIASTEKLLHSDTDTFRFAQLIRRLQKAREQLAANCNPKLVLDRVFL